jgi:hypothetical protein
LNFPSDPREAASAGRRHAAVGGLGWRIAVLLLGWCSACGSSTSAASRSSTRPDEKPPNTNGCALSIPAEGAKANVVDTDGLFPESFTIDFWLRVDRAAFDIADPTTFPPHRLVAVHSTTEGCDGGTPCGDAWLSAGISTSDHQDGVYCALVASANGATTIDLMAGHTRPSAHSWHHVACELGPNGLGMWYDGKLSYWYGTRQGNAGYPSHYDHDGSPLVLGQGDGASPLPVEVEGDFAGALDEVRFSAGLLYDPHLTADGFTRDADSFTPAQHATLLDSTLALWHFDECTGTAAADAGPAGRSASLDDGATWTSGASPTE